MPKETATEAAVGGVVHNVISAVTIKAEDHHHWYEAKRWQGIGLVVVGAALTLVPLLPDTVGLTLVTTGLYWAGIGSGQAIERNKNP